MKKKAEKKTKSQPTLRQQLQFLTKLQFESLETQRESLETQKDIRAILFSMASDAKNAMEDTERKDLDSKSEVDKHGEYLKKARDRYFVSDGLARMYLRLDEEKADQSEQVYLDQKKAIDHFWFSFLQDRGMHKRGVLHVLDGTLSYKDLFSVLAANHGYPSNTTHCANKLETTLRKALRGKPDLRKQFADFFNETNKTTRSRYENVPVGILEMIFILDLLKEISAFDEKTGQYGHWMFHQESHKKPNLSKTES